MQEVNMKVVLVDRNDYKNHIRSSYGLDAEVLLKADLVIDRETGKVLASKHF